MISEHFAERMQRILLMAPLYRLERRHLQSRENVKISGMELGLLSLLFFFEQMLADKKDAGIRNLARFLREQTKDGLISANKEAYTDKDYENLARDIVSIFRPPTGRRTEQAFYDVETGKEVRARYSYLKADRADIQSNEQYYILDEQGLELIFATKEYFNEYQLSINQLILRKQLEKGQFALALRQIEEMRLDVETLRRRMTRIRQEIHRNIVSQKTLMCYQKIVDDFNQRLKSEEQTFMELKSFIRETKARIRGNLEKKMEQRAYENIMDVERHLELVHGMHRSLLKDGIDLGTSALTAAEESLYFTGIDSFNYAQEITGRLFSSPLPVRAVRTLVKPFLELERAEIWSPLDIFMPQRLERLVRENRQEAFPDVEEDDVEVRGEQLLNIQSHYAAIVKALLVFLQGRNKTTLSEFCRHLQEIGASFCQEKQFYVFWMLVHRHTSLQMESDFVRKKSVYGSIHDVCPTLAAIAVTEKTGVVDFYGYTISDMYIEVTYK